jgi:phosphatidylserine/phosphatidylglycerophosphate/cardiolipin synthase-like enzyme
MNNPLVALSDAALSALTNSLRDGVLASGLNRRTIEQITGQQAGDVSKYLETLANAGMGPQHMAYLVAAIRETRCQSLDPALLYDLVLSGPDVEGVPTADTAAVVQCLISDAKEEVVLVGYAVHNGKTLFRPLSERMRDDPTLRVVFYLNIGRPHGDTSLSSEIVRRFVQEFKSKHWPWPNVPELWYDPRALAEPAAGRASLHAKCVIIDRSAAIITSANFTEAAQHRNIEAGVIIRHEPTIRRLANYFVGLRESNRLIRCPISR